MLYRAQAETRYALLLCSIAHNAETRSALVRGSSDPLDRLGQMQLRLHQCLLEHLRGFGFGHAA